MGIVMGVTAVVLGLAAALVGVMLWTALIFPSPAGRTRDALVARPGRCFLMGVALALLVGVPVLVLLRSPHGHMKLAGWLLAFPLVALVALGMTAMAQLLGSRLQGLSEHMTPLAGLVRGAVILELTLALPIFGWFLFAPVLGLTLLGAGAMGVASRGTQGRASASHADGAAPGGDELASIALQPVLPAETGADRVPEVWRLSPEAAPGGTTR